MHPMSMMTPERDLCRLGLAETVRRRCSMALPLPSISPTFAPSVSPDPLSHESPFPLRRASTVSPTSESAFYHALLSRCARTCGRESVLVGRGWNCRLGREIASSAYVARSLARQAFSHASLDSVCHFRSRSETTTIASPNRTWAALVSKRSRSHRITLPVFGTINNRCLSTASFWSMHTKRYSSAVIDD